MPPLSPADEARSLYSKKEFCPLHRVEAGTLVRMPTPPPKIAQDPERYAMWRAAQDRRLAANPRQLIAVSGCDEDTALYECASLLARDTSGRHATWAYLGATCSAKANAKLASTQSP
jgi:hypothetical protein